MATKPEILDLLATLSSVYGQEPGDTRGYYWALEEYDGETLEAAMKATVKACKWYPKPSEIRDAAAAIYEARKTGEMTERQIRDRAYYLFDAYRAGEITARDFLGDSAVKYVQNQYKIFTDVTPYGYYQPETADVISAEAVVAA